MSMASTLPPDVYEKDGKWYRRKVVVGMDEEGVYEEDDDREVILPISTNEKSIHESRELAAKEGKDFYDPRVVRNPQTGESIVIGWLDRGKKRHEDWPWNLGSGSVKQRRRPQKAAAVTSTARKEINNANG